MACPDDCDASYWECLACMGPPQAPRPLASWDKGLAKVTATTLVDDRWVAPLIEPMVKL